MTRAVPLAIPDRLSYVLVLVLSLIWGSSFLLTALALEGFSPFAVAFGRVGFASLSLWLMLSITRTRLPRDPGVWIWCAANGVLALALPFVLLAWEMQSVPSGTAALFVAAVPLLILALSRLVYGDAITPQKWGGFVIGLLGLLWLIGPEALLELGSSGQGLGQLACLGAALGYAVGAMIVRGMPPANAIPATAAAHMSATVAMAPFGLAALPSALPTAGPIVALLVLGAVQTGLAQTLRFIAIRRSGPVFVSTVGYLIPIWAGVLGLLILDEPMTLRALAAYALILGGLLLARGRDG
jgi:drug/metabolite transporter (DMT)-like permease